MSEEKQESTKYVGMWEESNRRLINHSRYLSYLFNFATQCKTR